MTRLGEHRAWAEDRLAALCVAAGVPGASVAVMAGADELALIRSGLDTFTTEAPQLDCSEVQFAEIDVRGRPQVVYATTPAALVRVADGTR